MHRYETISFPRSKGIFLSQQKYVYTSSLLDIKHIYEEDKYDKSDKLRRALEKSEQLPRITIKD